MARLWVGLFCLRLASMILFFSCISDAVPLQKRQGQCAASGLTVDLDYSIYRGFQDSNGLYRWNNIRYGAPATGANRFQAPKPAPTYRASVISATKSNQAYICPQATFAPYSGDTCGSLVNAKSLPSTCTVKTFREDCLFLHVYAPPDAVDLPVLVYIHGGGYGVGSGGQYDAGALVNQNGQNFIAIAIQYRLGAFGFLASSSVKSQGTLNAGLYDQQFALKWVQDHICKFGGDASKVTIMGQSAGGGSVAAQILAMNGTLGSSLFRNAIAISPYFPKQYSYQDAVPTSAFNALAREVGCNKSATAFNCLVKKPTAVLQLAAGRIAASGFFATWAFVPVTDGTFLVSTPVAQLSTGNINGERILTSNTALDGAEFVPQNISSDLDFANFARLRYPNVDLAQIMANYPSNTGSNGQIFATNGFDQDITVNSQSSTALGNQARANNLYTEATFTCPSYWLAGTFAKQGLDSYKYQFSVAPALHSDDMDAYFGPLPLPRTFDTDFQAAVMHMIGNFVTSNDSSITDLQANGESTGDNSPNPASSWPKWTVDSPKMLNLNVTNGSPSTTTSRVKNYLITGIPIDVNPGLKNDFSIADATTWEGGRGARCDFLHSQAPNIPT